MTELKVALDGTSLTVPWTGVGQYTAQLAQTLRGLHDPPKLMFFYGSTWSNELYASSGDIPKRYILLHTISQRMGMLGNHVTMLKRRFNNYLQEQAFYKGIKKMMPDIVHGTNFHIYPSDIPTIITIHDLSCFRHPETHPPTRVKWQQVMLPKAIEDAQHILVVSEFTKREVIDYFSVSSEKITVTHNGVNDSFHPRASETCRNVLQHYNLSPQNYILSVGTLEPRKNLEILITAYSRLPKNMLENYSLAIVGMRGWKERKLMKQINPLVKTGKIKLLGYVPQTHLPFLYNGAKAFCYPSIYEGFGIPLLEAMASGTPVIAANATSLPEVVGDAGLLLDSRDVDAWTAGMEKILLDDGMHNLLLKKGLKRSAQFTWRTCAEKTRHVYETISAMSCPAAKPQGIRRNSTDEVSP